MDYWDVALLANARYLRCICCSKMSSPIRARPGADPCTLSLTAFGFAPCGRPLRRRGMESGVSGRSGPSHGLGMPRYIRTSLPTARLALVEIGMRWRGGVMPNLQSYKLRHLLKNSFPFARPLHRRRRFNGKEHSYRKDMHLTFAAPGVLSAAGWPRIVISRLMAAMASHHARR